MGVLGANICSVHVSFLKHLVRHTCVQTQPLAVKDPARDAHHLGL